jgi:basic amino acid/polyamine antiporter, APA family
MTDVKPQAILRSVDIISLIVGTVVGAGIYKSPALVAGALASPWWIMLAWAGGGVASIIGALCYVELATAYPSFGGEFHFIGKAFGQHAGFIYAWARSIVILPAAIALFAITLGDYLTPVWSLGAHSATVWALLLIVLLSGLNALGVRLARTAQNAFALIEIGTVIAIVIAGWVGHGQTVHAAMDHRPGGGGVGFAFIFVLLTYGGWNEAAYVSAEVADGRRGILRGVLYGLGTVTTLYLLINAAYLWGLGHSALAQSSAPAADLFRVAFGNQSGTLLSAIVAFSCMKAISATIFFGSRSNYAVGLDWQLFRWLGQWHPCGAPRRGILMLAALSIGLVLLAALTPNGFQAIVEFEAPVFWLFILATALSLFVLRYRFGLPEGAFAVPLYPWLPAVFVLNSAGLLWSSIAYTGAGAWIGVLFLAAGILPLMAERRLRTRMASKS